MMNFRILLPLFLGALVLLAAVSGTAYSEVPRKQPVGRYVELWTKSPFTVPPVEVVPDVVEKNPLEDYTLGGVIDMNGGWFVVLINKKNRDERIRIKPNAKSDHGFTVLNVQSGTKFKDVRVEISHHGKAGWVEYDEKFLVLKKAVAAVPRGQPNGRPGGAQRPGAPGTANGRGRPTIPTRGGTPGQAGRVPTPPTPGGARGGAVVPRPTGNRTSPAGQSGGRSSRGRPSGERSSRGRGR